MKRYFCRATNKLARARTRGLGPAAYYSTAVTHPDPQPGSKTYHLVDKDSEHLLTTYSRPPLVLTHGKGAHVWDLEGRKFIDFTAGIAVTSLGHGDEQIAQLLHDQASRLIHASNLYYNEWAGQLADLIVEQTLLRGGMNKASKVFFSNSGSEANEGAIKFARKVGKLRGGQDKVEIVSFTNAFHGRTFAALTATPNAKYKDPFSPMVPDFEVAEFNNVDSLDIITERTCGVIIEPVQGEGGVFAADPSFLQALRAKCDAVGAVLIYDEIQCGLGRTGDLWAVTPDDAQPHVITMAKPLANGIPIGAILCTKDVADAIKVGDHGTTFGGNPLACHIGHHCFTRLSSSQLLAHVQEMGDILQSRLKEFTEKYSGIVVQARGKGLLQGLGLNRDPSGVVEFCRHRGLLVITAGNNTVRFVPPLVISKQVLNNGLDILEEALATAPAM